MKRYLVSTGILSMLVLFVLSIRPVSLSKNDSVKITGTVASTSYNENNHDLLITLVGDNRQFYINRAFEKGLRPMELEKILNKRLIKFSYADQWTLLDPFGRFRHITELALKDSLIFSEFESH